eukprot:COSAG03_NODE_1437_length_4080_cov_2.349410_2_plen_75_part_00
MTYLHDVLVLYPRRPLARSCEILSEIAKEVTVQSSRSLPTISLLPSLLALRRTRGGRSEGTGAGTGAGRGDAPA